MTILNRVAVSSVTYRDVPLADALRQLQTAGFSRLDLVAIRHYCDHFDPLLVSVGEEECQRVRDLLAAAGVTAVSLTSYPGNPLAPDLKGDDWRDGIDSYVRMGQCLATEFLIIPPGRPAPPADRWRGTVERAKWWLQDAATRAINVHIRPVLALQSHSLLRTSQQGMDLLHILNLSQAGLAVDPAHLRAMGEDPAEAIRRMGGAVAFVVVRDTDGSNFNLPPGSGSLDYPAILGALEEIGYAGPLVLAIDDITLPLAQRYDLLQRGRDFLDKVSQRKAA